LSIMKKI